MLTNASAAPIVLGVAAAAVWGAADFAGGLAARRGAPGFVIFVAHGASLVLLGAFLLAAHPAPLSGPWWAWSLLSGIFNGIALMLFYEALSAGAMGLSAALAGVLTPALPVAVSVVREGRPATTQVAGFLVAAVAIGLIAWSPQVALSANAPGTSLRSLGLSTLAGLGFGVQLVVLHMASAQGSIVRALTLSRAGGAAAGAAAMLLAALRGRAAKEGTIAAPSDQATAAQGSAPAQSRTALRIFLALAALVGLLDTAGNGLYMGAALVGRMDVAAVLSSLYPGATILLAIWLLKERATWLQAAGMVLALVAVALISA